MMFAPLEGFRHVKVADRHTALDYAQVLKETVRHALPRRKENLPGAGQSQYFSNRRHSTKPSFPAAEARRLVERFESGTIRLNVAAGWIWAESEFGDLSSQCLGRRIPDTATVIGEVAAWEKDRNKRHTKADWQFTTADARIKTEAAALPSF